MSIQESNKSGKLGEQLDGSMKYRQAENQGDCPHTETVSREKGQTETASRRKGGRNVVLMNLVNLAKVAQTNVQ